MDTLFFLGLAYWKNKAPQDASGQSRPRMLNFVLAVCGGAGIFLAPWICYRALLNSRVSKQTGFGYSVAGVAGVMLSVFLASSAFGWALVSFILTLVVVLIVPPKRTQQEADFVVEGPLLAEALSPHLEAELIRVEEEARVKAAREGGESYDSRV